MNKKSCAFESSQYSEDHSRALDSNDELLMNEVKDKPRFILLNKSDLDPQWEKEEIANFCENETVISISAKTGIGLNNLKDAIYVGKGLDELDIFWFEEPVAPEDYEGYRQLRSKISTSIAGGEAEFTKYGWNKLISNNCIDIAQPEVCGLGGITEYLKVSALAQANFIPVINHVWGSAISIAVNLHLLTAQPDMPGGLFPSKSMLEFDTTEKNIFITDLPNEDFSILKQVNENNGFASVTDNIGIGITPNKDFINEFEINE